MSRLQLPLLLALAPAALAQVPDAEPALLTTPGSTTPGDATLLQVISAGEDEGWVVSGEAIDANGSQVAAILGELTDDDPAGARVLRTAGTFAGVTQSLLASPRLADGRIGYVSTTGTAGETVGWIDDTLIARSGAPLAPLGGSWGAISAVQPLIGGGAVIEGTATFGVLPVLREALVHHPSGAILLREGQPVPGTSDTIETILATDVSPSGDHVVAVVRLTPSGRSAILKDGVLLDVQPFIPAIQGQLTGGVLPQGTGGAFLEFRAAFVQDGGRVTLEAMVETSAGLVRRSIVRDGREIEADGPPLVGADARGGALSGVTGLDASILRFEGEDIGIQRDGVDIDDDGVADPLLQARALLLPASVSGSGRVLAVVRILDNRSGAPVFRSAVLRSVRKSSAEVVCSGQVNSRGRVASLETVGSVWAGYNRMRLVATGLPWNAFGLPLVSRTPSAPVQLPGSQGLLCLGGSIGRAPFSTLSAGFSGAGASDLFLNLFPQGSSYVQVLPGETWYLQMWYRDLSSGALTSNTTDAIAVSFR